MVRPLDGTGSGRAAAPCSYRGGLAAELVTCICSPADLVNLMQSRTLLFLGYGLRDWNFRVLLDRLNRLRLQPLKSYAISDGTDAAERRLWEKRFVEIFNADLNEFVPRLAAEMEQETSLST